MFVGTIKIIDKHMEIQTWVYSSEISTMLVVFYTLVDHTECGPDKELHD